MSSTSKQFSFGDIREDGFLFDQYTKDGKARWYNPQSYCRKRIATVMCSARKRAAIKQIPFDVTLDYLFSIFPEDNKCPVFGITLSWGDREGRNNSPSLDRIHPALGYVEGNVMWISHYANRLKSDHTLDTLRTLLAFYEKLERKD